MNRNPFPAFELSSLPRLPIPPLEDTLQRYLTQVQPLLSDEEFATTQRHVKYVLHRTRSAAAHVLSTAADTMYTTHGMCACVRE
jgi:hypothetical protein